MSDLTPVAVTGAPPYSRPTPLGEVHVYVYGWEPGKCEVSVAFPEGARNDDPDAAIKQDQFRQLVLAELDKSIRFLSG